MRSQSLASLKPLDGESLASFRARRPGLYNTVLGLLCFGLFCSNVVQGVFFKRMADDIETAPYFLLLFCSTLFVLVFGSTMVVRWVLDIIKNKLINSHLLFNELLKTTAQRTRVSHAWLADHRCFRFHKRFNITVCCFQNCSNATSNFSASSGSINLHLILFVQDKKITTGNFWIG
jgi:hypothetical protein